MVVFGKYIEEVRTVKLTKHSPNQIRLCIPKSITKHCELREGMLVRLFFYEHDKKGFLVRVEQ